MIQILGLRPFAMADGTLSKKHSFFERHWCADNVAELFQDLGKHIHDIPDDERWNMYFTVCQCIGQSPRDFSHQNVLPFDIDDIDCEKVEETLGVVLRSLGLNHDETISLFSGHGLQLFVDLKRPIEDITFFVQYREFYKQICSVINLALNKACLKGKADPTVFSARRLMRLPETTNRKDGLPDVKSYIIQGDMGIQAVTLEGLCGMPSIPQSEQINALAMAKFPEIDKKGVLTGCEFLKWCKANQSDVSEPQWYAMLSILCRIDEELCHSYSKESQSYNEALCGLKIKQALISSGPRTCKGIGDLYDCKKCKYFGKVKSPVVIRGADFIATKATGFYTFTVHKDTGLVVKSKVPCYEDLYRYLKKQAGPILSYEDSGECIRYDGKYWLTITTHKMKNFAERNLDPAPFEHHRIEFVNKVKAKKSINRLVFQGTINMKLNLQNGVYDIKEDKLLPHDDSYGFMYVLPYEYDADAKAPVFEKFMQDITMGDVEKEKVLLEYAGYCISNDIYWKHKALMLVGDGANGKSTFMDVLKAMVGKDNYGALSLSALNSATNRYMIENKLFNFGEETSVDSLGNSEEFKILSAGGEYTIKQLYMQPYKAFNKCKLVFSCNELPKTMDVTNGLLRRLLFVPFDARFDEGDVKTDNFILEKLVAERSGIFNILVEHYKNLCANKEFSECLAAKKMMGDFRHLNNKGFYYSFETDCIVTGDSENSIWADDLYDRYVEYYNQRTANLSHWQMKGNDIHRKVSFLRLINKYIENKGAKSIRKTREGKKLYFYEGLGVSIPHGDF